jgi:APA family basic amino acid/polyamine antiporter
MAEQEFKKELKLFDSIMIVAGTMIGSGIFLVSADIARQVGSSGWLLIIWLLTGFITIAGALSYGELAGMMPKAGGQYVYLREAWGKPIAFLYAWTLFLVIQTGTIAAVGVAFAKYTGVLLPDLISEDIVLMQVAGLKINSVQILAILSIVLLTYINSKGVKNGKLIQNVFGSTKIVALFGLIIVGLLFGVNADVVQQNFSDLWSASVIKKDAAGTYQIYDIVAWGIVPALGVAMVGSLFSSDAWNNIGFSGDEIQNPKRNLVLSMVIGTSLVTIIYILMNVVYLLVLPLKGDPAGTDVMARGIQFATNDRVATAVAEAVGGSSATILMSLLIMIATFGCNNGCILSGARVYYATAKDGLFFNGMSKLNKFSVPGNALIYQCVWACILCISGSYGDLLDYVVFAVLLFYILTILGIFKLRKSNPDAERPYKAFGYPFIPILYILLASAVCIILLVYKPNYSWPGLIIVAMGVPVYAIFKNKIKEIE